MLAGLPQAPSAYDPETHFALAKQRQQHVLDQLVVNHILTSAQANAAYRERLVLENLNTSASPTRTQTSPPGWPESPAA